MGLSEKASNSFRDSTQAKSDYTPEELAKAEAYLREEGFVLPGRYASATLHRFVKDSSASATLYLEGTGTFQGALIIMNYSSEWEAIQTRTTIRDYVQQKEIEAKKTLVAKPLKRVI